MSDRNERSLSVKREEEDSVGGQVDPSLSGFEDKTERLRKTEVILDGGRLLASSAQKEKMAAGAELERGFFDRTEARREFRTYKRRFWVMALFALISLVQMTVWGQREFCLDSDQLLATHHAARLHTFSKRCSYSIGVIS
ncbi:uncharacterized protein LOC122244865 [Penaeus japonicus]|uniref:uncharacterized protein LOC122244865 n=1 Tax=Penaeus japonicus TaxID=27405 RepID=UPI001C711BDD|nr:uncharacterized protein LOC122244865 [Penaeus japonicus]